MLVALRAATLKAECPDNAASELHVHVLAAVVMLPRNVLAS
jgi:hypothetical protein